MSISLYNNEHNIVSVKDLKSPKIMKYFKIL